MYFPAIHIFFKREKEKKNVVFQLCLLICASHDYYYHKLDASPLEMQGWLEKFMCQFISSNFPCNRTTVHGKKKSNLNMGQVDEAGPHPDLVGMMCWSSRLHSSMSKTSFAISVLLYLCFRKGGPRSGQEQRAGRPLPWEAASRAELKFRLHPWCSTTA